MRKPKVKDISGTGAVVSWVLLVPTPSSPRLGAPLWVWHLVNVFSLYQIVPFNVYSLLRGSKVLTDIRLCPDFDRENDITPVLDHTFCVEHNAFGRILQHELKPNGRNVPVTEDNKKEYVRLYVNWRFMRGIEAQFLALQKGFNELIPQHLLKPFDQKELEAAWTKST
uniref:HECT-type E3 ubiquitin transferase n=1 Tax=Molossus molossus TaxID=27622 RepID=A0A7J8ID32_MOLMO|nr:SMAD specific E3 ubiquitin protein ligase 1 [Molossus molossus]